jgi:hypothetical protein
MIRPTTAVLLATVLASPALAQSSTGQADLKAQLEAARAPLYSGGNTIPGYTASYSAVPENCVTHIDVMIPNHSYNGQSFGGSVTRKDVDWEKVTGVELSNNYVIVRGPALASGGEYFFAGSTQGAQRMKATMDGLRTSCAGSAANNAAIADAQRRFRASIEQSTTLGNRFVTGRNDEPCVTKFATMQAGKTEEQVIADGLWIRWKDADRVTFEPGRPDAEPWWRNYVEVGSPTGTWPLHPSPEQVGAMMAAANELIALCKTAAVAVAAPAPTPAPVPAKRTFQVTANMVESDPPDTFLRKHYYDLPLTGRTGDRYRLSWEGPVAVNLDYSETYDAEYPEGSSIFDLSSVATITLLEDGEHIVVFDQMGVEYPEDNSNEGSLLGPSLSGGRPRAFAPFTLTVEKLN